MPWTSANALFEQVEEEYKVWDRSELDRVLGFDRQSVGRREQIAKRNSTIRAQHDRGVSVEGLIELHHLSERQLLRIIQQGRSK